MSTDDTRGAGSELTVAAAQSIPPGMAIMKLENDNIQAMAVANPRDHKQIRRELAEQLEAYPEFARKAIYNKPVGKDENGHMKFARGLSIRAAEAIAEAYGYCRVRSDVTPVDDDTVRIEATFTDYQKGRIWQDAGLLSKWYKPRNGGRRKHNDDRFYNVVVKAEVSKRIREVITRSVPPGLRAALEEMAERQINELLDDSTMEKIIGKFSTKGVDLAQLESRLGRTRSNGWTKGDRSLLLGLWNAIEDGETTVAEAFEEDVASEPQSLNQLTGAADSPAAETQTTGDTKEQSAADTETVGDDADLYFEEAVAMYRDTEFKAEHEIIRLDAEVAKDTNLTSSQKHRLINKTDAESETSKARKRLGGDM